MRMRLSRNAWRAPAAPSCAVTESAGAEVASADTRRPSITGRRRLSTSVLSLLREAALRPKRPTPVAAGTDADSAAPDSPAHLLPRRLGGLESAATSATTRASSPSPALVARRARKCARAPSAEGMASATRASVCRRFSSAARVAARTFGAIGAEAWDATALALATLPHGVDSMLLKKLPMPSVASTSPKKGWVSTKNGDEQETIEPKGVFAGVIGVLGVAGTALRIFGEAATICCTPGERLRNFKDNAMAPRECQDAELHDEYCES
mmetsp:Transcript_49416/g.140141  ORF Transcript_49416/g.140141 Transcript_49416/m.140141 type:complete len:267 (+) Transcript_49416:596-1396(+)